VSFLLGSAASNSPTNQQPVYTGLPIQTAVNTLPIPICYGSVRIAPNLIWYSDFIFYEPKQAGKGLGGGKSSGGPTGTQYAVSVILALCEGPVPGVHGVWRNQSAMKGLPPGFVTFLGTHPDQSPWSYVTTKHASEARPYPGVCYEACANYQLGSSPQLPLHNFLIRGFFWESAPWSPEDADLGLVIQDFLSNEQYGVPSFADNFDMATLQSSSEATTTGDATLQTYCRANGWGYSIKLQSQESAKSILARWLQLANTAPVWSERTLKFFPYGDEEIIANGVHYKPNLTPLYNLTDDDFVGDAKADPVQVTRSDFIDAKNILRVEITNRFNEYAIYPLEVRDEGQVDVNGPLVGNSITAHEISLFNSGYGIGRLILNRMLYVRQTFTFTLSVEYCLLQPMDLVTIPNQVTGAPDLVRIIQIEEDADGNFKITAENVPIGTQRFTVSDVQQNQPTVPDTDIEAAPANTPLIYEPPSPILVPRPEIWIGASGSNSGVHDPNWGGAQVWASVDDVNYAYLGDINGPARQGVITNTVGGHVGANPDTTTEINVDLSESGGVLQSSTDDDATYRRTLAYVDGELVGYVNADLIPGPNPYAYKLTRLYRGLAGTPITSHAPGSRFCRLDDNIFSIDLPSEYIGKTIFVKLVSFNIWRAGYEDISTVARYSYMPAGSPVGPGAPTRLDDSHSEWSGFNLVMGIM
jgi:hypothetical protein